MKRGHTQSIYQGVTRLSADTLAKAINKQAEEAEKKRRARAPRFGQIDFAAPAVLNHRQN